MSTVEGVSTRTALKALNTSTITIAVLNEARRSGQFVWTTGNYSPYVAADPQEGVYIKADSVAASDGAWVRVFNGPFNVDWFGAVGDGVNDDTTAIQAAITLASTFAGGHVYLPRGYAANGLTVSGSNVRLSGDSPGKSSIKNSSATGAILTITGSKHIVEHLLIFRDVLSTTAASQILFLSNAVECNIDDCWLQGGYNLLTCGGISTASITVTRCIFTQATGPEMVLLARSTNNPSHVVGAIHFYRCTFNQAYPVVTPTSGNYKGARTNNMSGLAAGDIVQFGNYYLQAVTASGNTGSSPPALALYGTPIVDNGVTWQLMGHAAYCGLRIDSGTSYIRVCECDLTSPFANAILIVDTFGYGAPVNVHIRDCTAHGPISNGIFIGAGREIQVDMFNSFNPTGPGATYGILVNGSGNDVISGAEISGYGVGVGIQAPYVTVTGSQIVGNQTGIYVFANYSLFDVTGNQLGGSGAVGANVKAMEIATGVSQSFVIAGNIFAGAGSGLTNGAAGSPNQQIANNA